MAGKKGTWNMNQEQKEELLHLESCLSLIQENIRLYEAREQAGRKEVTALFQAVKKGEGDSYGQLTASQNILEHTQNALRKNRAALKKPYFGRIDYDDLTYESTERLYIGKNGITKNQTDVVIVDWRAPAASIYYENELGHGFYHVPEADDVEIDLHRKRTYDISDGKLLGFYDDDVAANDELLVKYLSQNKEAVLGDIIATIQKEQNEIIRDIPSKNIIVQGVAGSGKTTVALHRISYLLYNYEDKYKPAEFCIIGGNDMLLNYISSGLPELDVKNVRQMRMDAVFPYFLGNHFKKSFRIVPDLPEAPLKSRLSFVRKLDAFLKKWQEDALSIQDITDPELGVVLSSANMEEARFYHPDLSLFQTEKLFNERLASRIRFLCTERTPEYKKAKLLNYRKYFDSSRHKWTEDSIYLAFLETLSRESEESCSLFSTTIESVRKKQFDVYDAAALALIKKRILQKKEMDEFSQIIIDEAQDFGETVYYVLKEIFPPCFFTIMGDVSQNIRYETGMNDWESLKKALFKEERDSFYLLAKSYRNTIEISQYAGKVLEKASQGSYRIQPVIRHGLPPEIHRANTASLPALLLETVAAVKAKNFETIAVVCRTEDEAAEVRSILDITDADSSAFHNGVMVLPVMLTKGLEFDCVILWKPDESRYGNNPREAKLLYVAITRALHELHLMLDADPSSLLL